MSLADAFFPSSAPRLDVAQASPYLMSLLEARSYDVCIRVVAARVAGLNAPDKSLFPYAVAYRTADREGTKVKVPPLHQGTCEPAWDATIRFLGCQLNEMLKLEVKAQQPGRNHLFGFLEFSVRDIIHTEGGGANEMEYHLSEDGRSSVRLQFALNPPVALDPRPFYCKAYHGEASPMSSRSPSPSVKDMQDGRARMSLVDLMVSPRSQAVPSTTDSQVLREPAYLTLTEGAAGLCAVMLDNNVHWWRQQELARVEEARSKKKTQHSRNTLVLSPRGSRNPSRNASRNASRRNSLEEGASGGAQRRVSSSNLRTMKIVSMSHRNIGQGMLNTSKLSPGRDGEDSSEFFGNHTYQVGAWRSRALFLLPQTFMRNESMRDRPDGDAMSDVASEDDHLRSQQHML